MHKITIHEPEDTFLVPQKPGGVTAPGDYDMSAYHPGVYHPDTPEAEYEEFLHAEDQYLKPVLRDDSWLDRVIAGARNLAFRAGLPRSGGLIESKLIEARNLSPRLPERIEKEGEWPDYYLEKPSLGHRPLIKNILGGAVGYLVGNQMAPKEEDKILFGTVGILAGLVLVSRFK